MRRLSTLSTPDKCSAPSAYESLQTSTALVQFSTKEWQKEIQPEARLLTVKDLKNTRSNGQPQIAVQYPFYIQRCTNRKYSNFKIKYLDSKLLFIDDSS